MNPPPGRELRRILAARTDLFVVAGTDAAAPGEIVKRQGGRLPPNPRIGVASCTELLKKNLRSQETR